MNYENSIVFTENNIVAYLAELEEYISSLITYMAFKRDEPNAATSAIPLEQLNDKKFGQRDLEIEPPPSMPYKGENDKDYEDALRDGHLPGEEDDFFTEHKIKQYFQNVVEQEFEREKQRGREGAIVGGIGGAAGNNEGGPLDRAQPHEQSD